MAPNGRDEWSGERAAIQPPAGPKATIQSALNQAREARKNGQTDAIEIILRGGTSYLREPLTFTPADSGLSSSSRLIIRSHRNEKAVLSGGIPVAGWEKLGNGPLWRAPLKAETGISFHQLFVNGQRKQRARTPNEGFFRIQGPSPQDKPIKIKFKEGEIKKAWAERGDVELVALLAWADIRMPIREVDEENRTATLAGDPRSSNREANAQYFIENAPDGLDQPGEWYWDRQYMMYWPLPGEDLKSARVTVARPGELVVFQGNFDQKKAVEFVSLDGLEFAETDWVMPEKGYADTQAAIAVHGAVRMDGARDCVIENCRFSNLAGYGLDLGRGCQRIRVQRNEFTQLGGGGVRVGEPSIRADAFERTEGTQIADNEMNALGRIFFPAVGVLILQSGENQVVHNHIHDLLYTAISVGWTWGYRESPCRSNLIEYNHLHDIGQNRLSDMGAVYTLGPQPGTRVRNNLIHDVVAFTYGGWGLYPDEGSTGILFENNVVYRTKSAGFHQHYGRENIVRNNIFAFGKEHQLMRTREEPHISFLFETNIVYFDSGDLLGSNWKNDRFVIDHNLYYDARNPGPEKLHFGKATFADWQARGHDTNSIIADPMFLDPGHGDFRIKDNSPAKTLGFKPIDLSTVGPRKSD